MAAELGEAELIRPVAHLRLKAFALLFFTLFLVVGSALYLMVARGAFEPTQRLVLIADDSEGVVVGMDMTFSGFPIGRVRRIELGGDGTARILIDVPQKDAHWLRVSSVFTLVRGIVGGTGIRAYTGMLEDAALPDGAERPVLRGDATAEIPQLMSSARELLGHQPRQRCHADRTPSGAGRRAGHADGKRSRCEEDRADPGSNQCAAGTH